MVATLKTNTHPTIETALKVEDAFRTLQALAVTASTSVLNLIAGGTIVLLIGKHLNKQGRATKAEVFEKKMTSVIQAAGGSDSGIRNRIGTARAFYDTLVKKHSYGDIVETIAKAETTQDAHKALAGYMARNALTNVDKLRVFSGLKALNFSKTNKAKRAKPNATSPVDRALSAIKSIEDKVVGGDKTIEAQAVKSVAHAVSDPSALAFEACKRLAAINPDMLADLLVRLQKLCDAAMEKPAAKPVPAQAKGRAKRNAKGRKGADAIAA